MEPGHNNQSQDDQTWFAALIGNVKGGQGEMLRGVLRAVELAEASQEDVRQDWQRLRFAIRREQGKGARARWVLPKYFALAASVLIVIGSVYLIAPEDEVNMPTVVEEQGAMRGFAAQVVRSENPSQEAAQLELELRKLGVKVNRSRSADKVELHIVLTHPVSDEIRAVLEQRLIPLPEEGNLMVVLIPQNQ